MGLSGLERLKSGLERMKVSGLEVGATTATFSTFLAAENLITCLLSISFPLKNKYIAWLVGKFAYL